MTDQQTGKEPVEFRCLACNQMIPLPSTSCPFCSLTPDQRLAQRALEAVEEVNKACEIASGLRSGNIPLALLYLGLTFWQVFYADTIYPRLVFVQLLPPAMLLVIARWFYKYRKLQVQNPDYPQAKTTMKTSLQIWILVFAAQIFLVAIVIPRYIRK